MERLAVSYSMDAAERDAWVRELSEGKETLQVRIQPAVLNQGNYKAWPGVTWLLTLPDAESAIQLRETLKAFFAAVERTDLGEVRQVLQGL